MLEKLELLGISIDSVVLLAFICLFASTLMYIHYKFKVFNKLRQKHGPNIYIPIFFFGDLTYLLLPDDPDDSDFKRMFLWFYITIFLALSMGVTFGIFSILKYM